MKFNFSREWLERMARAEDEAGDITVISPEFRAFMEATGPYDVYVVGGIDPVNFCSFRSFQTAVHYADSLDESKVIVVDKPTGNVVYTNEKPGE